MVTSLFQRSTVIQNRICLPSLALNIYYKCFPKGTHDYQKFIRPSELAKFARDASLELDTLTGMTYNPFTKKYRLSDNVDVNYLMYLNKTQ